MKTSFGLPQHVDDLLELESGGDVQRGFSVVILDVGFGVSLQQQRNQAMTFSLTDVMKSRVPLVVDSVDADVGAQHGLHHSQVLPLFLQHDEVSEQQDGHQDGDHQIIQQRERPLGGVVETRPLFLIGQLAVGLVVQQVSDHIQVTMAAGSDEGGVPGVHLLNIQVGGVISEEEVQLTDVALVRSLAGRLRKRRRRSYMS